MILNVVIIAQRTLKKALYIIIITQLLNILCFRIRVSYPTHTYTVLHTLSIHLRAWCWRYFSIDKKHIEIRLTNVRPIIWWFRLNSFIKTYSSILYFAPFICLHQHIILLLSENDKQWLTRFRMAKLFFNFKRKRNKSKMPLTMVKLNEKKRFLYRKTGWKTENNNDNVRMCTLFQHWWAAQLDSIISIGHYCYEHFIILLARSFHTLLKNQ